MLRVPVTPAALVATGTVKSDANKLTHIICGSVVSLSFHFYPSAGR